jgi:hypothetical protein
VQAGSDLVYAHISEDEKIRPNFHLYLKPLRAERQASLLLKASLKIADAPTEKFRRSRFADSPVPFRNLP